MNRLLCAILLLLMISPTAAQDAAPFPVLDEAAIFADGVTVIERLPDIEFDWDARKLYYFDTVAHEWAAYSLPDNMVIPNVHELQTDGTYILARLNDGGKIYDHTLVWRFNPETGEFWQPELNCGVSQIFSIWGAWRIYQAEDSDSYFLCNRFTGEMLPVSDMWQGADLTANIYSQSTSPDGQWVVFYVGTPSDNLTYFAYNITTQSLSELGQFEVSGAQYFDWLDNETIVISDYVQVLQVDRVYIAKVAQPNSLLYSGEDATIEDNPPTILWVDWAEREDGVWDIVVEYDIATHQHNTLFEYQCGMMPVECGSRIVARSQDNRYFAIGTKLTGGAQTTFWIYDTVQEQMIYQGSHGLMNDLEWTPENTLLILDEEGIKRFNLATLEIDLIVEIPFSDQLSSLWMSPNQEAVIYRQGNTYQIYHVQTDQIYSVVQAEYSLFAQWADNGDVLVEVRNQDCTTFPCFGGSWHIRIDALDEENS